jgi:hypothetical protein
MKLRTIRNWGGLLPNDMQYKSVTQRRCDEK